MPIRISYNELRALHFLWRLREPFRCEGEVWSFYREPTLAINRDTLKLWIRRGWIQRCYKYENPDHDEYSITLDGIQAAQGYESDFFKKIERKIDAKL